MIAAVQSKNNRLCPLHRCPLHRQKARKCVKRRSAPPDCHDKRPRASELLPARNVTIQRQTYDPLTSTRTQAVPAAAAPTAAPPTTARRVCRRATPATLTGVNGRPTLACAL